VINAIRKEEGDQRSPPASGLSADLWLEKEIRSVANVARSDVREFLALAAEFPSTGDPGIPAGGSEPGPSRAESEADSGRQGAQGRVRAEIARKQRDTSRNNPVICR